MLVAFTRPDGGTVEINPDHVASVEAVRPGIYDPRAATVIVEDGTTHAVVETLAEVNRKLGVS